MEAMSQLPQEDPMPHRIIDSPLGRIILVVDGDDALTAVQFEGQRHAWNAAALGPRDDDVATVAVAQIGEYFAGDRTRFDLALAPRGTEFQQRVWDAIAQVPFGATKTYGEVAHALGAPGSSRAVGAATGRNPISIIVPCHRVMGGSRRLTGYAGGIDRKRWLLTHEGVELPQER